MQVPKVIMKKLLALRDRVSCREADFVIGGQFNPYLVRWWVIPRNRFFNVYLHWFLRSDDDRALHDHPWMNWSLPLDNDYTEHTISEGGIHHRNIVKAGQLKFRRSGKMAHRVELTNGPVWTLFFTGPVYRHWGFHCPEKGWVPWQEFVARDDKGGVGKGCN